MLFEIKRKNSSGRFALVCIERKSRKRPTLSSLYPSRNKWERAKRKWVGKWGYVKPSLSLSLFLLYPLISLYIYGTCSILDPRWRKTDATCRVKWTSILRLLPFWLYLKPRDIPACHPRQQPQGEWEEEEGRTITRENRNLFIDYVKFDIWSGYLFY